jgi:hypothetical protein
MVESWTGHGAYEVDLRFQIAGIVLRINLKS